MQRLSKLIVLLTIFCVLFPQNASAHISGQPPFFLMNGKYADFYPIYSTSLSDFTLPQDIGPETYLVNKPISFKIDTKLLPFPPEVIDGITYAWDFGDGEKASGTKNRHTYTKPGSYLLTIKADYGDYQGPNTKQLIQAVLLHVLPSTDYHLPKATIIINDTPITDPLVDTLTLPQGKKVSFRAEITKGSAPVTSYFWDVGDGTSKKEQSFTYTYPKDAPSYVFPFLRVKDTNGFIVDTYVQIENSQDQNKERSSLLEQHPLYLLFGVNAILLIGGGYVLLRKKNT